VESGGDLSADIVIAGVPSGGEAVSDELLGAVKPRVIIIADSEYPSWERASARLRDRLDEKRVTVIYTRFDGASMIDIRNGKWRIKTMQRGSQILTAGNTNSVQR